MKMTMRSVGSLVLAGLVLTAGVALAQDGGDIHVHEAGRHGDFFELFNRYWWLLFPLCWGIGALVKNIFRHHRATDALTLVKTYADQGKEPPPELLAVLRQTERDMPRLNGSNFATYGWIPVFLFGALTCGFVMMGVWRPDDSVPRPAMFFVALIMAGLCIGNLVAMQVRKKQDQVPPQ
jgi:hypothetical protein